MTLITDCRGGRMKKIFSILRNMSSEEGKKLFETISVSKSEPKLIHLLIIYCFSILFSFLPRYNSLIVTVIFILINSITLLGYFMLIRNKKYIKVELTSLFIYLILQITIFTVPLGIRADDTAIFGRYYPIFAIIYACSILFIIYWRVKRLTLSLLFQENILNHKNFKKKKLDKMIALGIVVLGLLIFGGTLTYRLIKSFWIVGGQSSSNIITIDNPWLGLLAVIITVTVLIALTVLFSLLPMLVFEPSKFVKVIVLGQQPEKYRKEYQITEREWYGNDKRW